MVVIGWWAFRLWGTEAAMLAADLARFDPNLLASLSLVTRQLHWTLLYRSTLFYGKYFSCWCRRRCCFGFQVSAIA